MENNLLKGVKTPQKVIVFGDYQIYNDMEAFKKYKLGDTSGRFLANLIKNDSDKDMTLPLITDLILDTDAEKLNEYNQAFLEELSGKVGIGPDVKINSFEDIANEGKIDLDEFKDLTFIGINENSLSSVRTYNLQDAESLYTELAKLTPFDYKGLVKFSKVFGLPFGIGEDVIDWTQLETKEPPVSIPVALITQFYIELMNYRYLFNHFKNVKLQNFEELQIKENQAAEDFYKLAKEMAEDIAKKTGVILPEFPDLETGMGNLKKHRIMSSDNENLLLRYKERLASFLGSGKRILKIQLDFDDGRFVPKIHFYDLFEFAHFQMISALINEAELRECEHCGHVFEVTYEGRRFCPPLPFRKRSSCEMAYNNKRRKENVEKTSKTV